MRGKLVAFDGSTFFISDTCGDVTGDDPDGFFYIDTRHLSSWLLFVDGQRIYPLTSRTVDYYSARVVGALGLPLVHENPDMTIHRNRIVSDGVHEDVMIANHAQTPRPVVVELRYEADFAELLDVKQQESRDRHTDIDVTGKDVTISYANGQFRHATRISFSVAGDIRPDRARFELELQPHEQWEMCIDISCIDGDGIHAPRVGHDGFGHLHPQMSKDLRQWFEEAPTIAADRPSIAETYKQSLLDLAALRYHPFPGEDVSLPAAGLPWFMTLMGRDCLLASYMSLPFAPELAQVTLETLAGLQASEDDVPRRRPGQDSTRAALQRVDMLGERPYSPYYGSHDATPLFLILLDEYERWTGDRELVRRLEPAARAALRWIVDHGDLDGDGYLEYFKRSPVGLDNQCWKDSSNSILFADGRQAEGPIAACEVQGYAYDAMHRSARLARLAWDDTELAGKLETDAAALAERFRGDFWCEQRKHPALALDGSKQHVDSLTSNIGHLLWSGILDDDQAAEVAAHLVGDELFSGLGCSHDVAGRHGLQPGRVPQRERVAARHRDRRRGAATLRLSRRGVPVGEVLARRRRRFRSSTAGAIRRLRPRRNLTAG